MTFVLIYLLMLFYQVTETPAATNTLTYYYDYRGSTIALTGDNGLPTDRMEYSLYGTMTYHAGSADTPFLFNGGYGVMTDPNGLLYMRARYYSPFLCRFLNPDPSGFAAGLNFYVYANGNPASMTDPMGLDALSENMPSASWDEIPMAQQKQVEDFLGGVANLATFGLANVVSSYATGKDVFGNNNLNLNDAVDQSFQTAALAASVITAIPTDGASLEADAVLEGADVGLSDLAEGGLQSAAETTAPNLMYHYTTASESSFANGLWEGSSVTDKLYTDAAQASQELGIPVPNKVIPIQNTGQFIPNAPSTVQRSFRFIGGGSDFINPQAVPPSQLLPAQPIGPKFPL